MNEIGARSVEIPASKPVGHAQAPFMALVSELNSRQVRYCHWKSNIRLPETLAGDEDFDVLVDRIDAATFLEALSDVGFKLALSRYGSGHPGVIHAFALDSATQRLLHVHAYFQVVTGDSLVKSYRLPFEPLLFGGDLRDSGIPLPPPEAELAVFVLRILLKHTSLAECLLVNRHYRSVPEELAWLRDRASDEAAQALWASTIPGATDGELDRLIAAIAEPTAVLRRIRLGLRLAWRLRDWRRLGVMTAAASRLWRLGILVSSRMRRRRPRSLVAGGAIVALVGPKASGKSTLGAALADRLGKQLDLRRIHVGKPPATLLSAPVRLMLPLLRKAMPEERSGEYQRPERREEGRYSLVYLVRMVLLAHDRRALLLRSRRAASEGAIVVADRYPSTEAGVIDGSQFDDATVAACGSRLKRFLMNMERRLYRGVPSPDLVVRLVAPIETTLLRDATRNKRDGPDPDSLRRRREIETAAAFPGVPAVTIRTDRALEQSVSDVVRGVWRHL
ncbi:hypothetical protein [Tropicimonas sediminicola]|uniref:Thymidylate kinase n=1 Tax=Tropicimonas sediminicola TaxID=1031541 RepID=A0A239LE29_9RHOB|nr:hypothetical protein [Tropicimonas sediminicola]SNT28741.1 Thymidylate kinase [Tropicimonas sediminicola]